jgi:hypothetical protein
LQTITGDFGRARELQRPRGAGRTGPATQIEDVTHGCGAETERVDNLPHRQKMQRAVIERVRRTLPSAVERGLAGKPLTPLDVSG